MLTDREQCHKIYSSDSPMPTISMIHSRSQMSLCVEDNGIGVKKYGSAVYFSKGLYRGFY